MGFTDFLQTHDALFPLMIFFTCLLGLVTHFWLRRIIQDNTVPRLEDRPVVGTPRNIRTFFTDLKTLWSIWSIVLAVEMYLLWILYMTIGRDLGLINSMISGIGIGVGTFIFGTCSFLFLELLTIRDRSIDQGAMNSLIDGLSIGCYGLRPEYSIIVRCAQLFMRMTMNGHYRRHLNEIYGTFPTFGSAVLHIFMVSEISNMYHFTLPFVYAVLWVSAQLLSIFGYRSYTFIMGHVIGVVTWIHAFFRGPTLVQDPPSESEQTSSQMLEPEKQEPEQEQETELEESVEV